MNKRKSFIRCRMILCLMLTLAISFGTCQFTQAATDKKYYIKINKGTNVVTVYETDGTPYTAFACSTGGSETPNGTFYLKEKYRWHQLYHDCYGQYCTRITGHVLFHSVWYYENKNPKSQSGRQYNRLGTTASSGCCRLTVAAAKWIYDNCSSGTKVIIFEGTAKDDPLGKPETIKVPEVRGWDPTDPDPNNPYETKSTVPKIKISSKKLTYGAKFGDGNMSCLDSGGFDITSWVKRTGKVNMKKIGTYEVKYDVIDSFGRTASKTVTYQVVDKKPASLTGVKTELTRELGTTRELLSGIKAKDSAGVNLTDAIKVYVKTPGAKEYVRLTDMKYKFTAIGTHYFKYVVTNPNNKLRTSKKLKVEIVDSGKPMLTSKDEWVDIEKEDLTSISWSQLMYDVQATLPGGEDLTGEVIVKITDENGKTKKLINGEKYSIPAAGIYQITYTVKNLTRNSAKGTYLSTSHNRTLIVSYEDEALQGDEINE